MKACVFHGVKDVRLESIAEPEIGPGDLLIRVGAAGLCYSDIRVYLGEKKATIGVIPGHETAGTIEAAGSDVDGFRVGERIAICPILACGHCYFCRRGLRNRCPERITLGYEVNGGMAQYMRVPAKLLELGHVYKVPDGMPQEIAALTEPSACVLNSLETCELQPGSSLAVIGAGPMGLLHIILARSMGVSNIIAVEPMEERQGYAKRFGATLVIDPSADNLERTVIDATDSLGADAVVVSTGRTEAAALSFGLVRKQGVVNLFGGFPPDARMHFDPNIVHYNEIRLTGSQNATPEQYRRALNFLSITPQIEEINTHRFTIDDSPNAYTVRLGAQGLKSVVVFPDAA